MKTPTTYLKNLPITVFVSIVTPGVTQGSFRKVSASRGRDIEWAVSFWTLRLDPTRTRISGFGMLASLI